MIARLLPARALALVCAIAFVIGPCAFVHGQLISSFHGAFQLTTPPAGWEYLWNSGGAIGNPANYTAMLANSSGIYTAGGIDSLPGPAPAANLNLNSNGGVPGGHPGLGATQSEAGGIERFVIAAYTLPAGSLVSIQNSNVVTTNPNTGGSKDGLNVRVYVGNSALAVISSSSAAGVGSSATFNGFLGNLSVGDKIYVAVGSKDDDLFDSFQLQYDIVAVPEPGSAILVGIGLLILAGFGRRK